MGSVVDYAGGLSEELLTVVCAGQDERFALEDAVCAGMLIDRLCANGDIELNDGAHAARQLFLKNQQSIPSLLKSCEHGRYLESLGFGEDLDVCGRVDRLKVLPIVKDGRITRPKRTRRK
jgi:2-phosphosulfolactate phosphatase